MLRVLLFVEPKPLPAHLFRNDYWINFPLKLIRQLHSADAGSYEFHIAFPKRFQDCLAGSEEIFGDRAYTISEKYLVRAIHNHQKTIRDIWISDYHGTTSEKTFNELDKQIGSVIPNCDWDIIISFGEEVRYTFARNRFCLNLETTPFGRFPFKHSFFMDHCGLFKNAAPQKFFPNGTGTTVAGSSLSGSIRSAAERILNTTRKIGFRKRFERNILLPLQASNYSSFDAQGNYNSQIDYLFDVCNQVPSDVGIVVTEHPSIPSIDVDNAFARICPGLQQVFPNATYIPRAKFFSSSSLSLLPTVDGVWTLASNVGPVASFLGMQTGTNANTHIAYSANEFSVAALCDQLGEPVSPKPVFDWMFANYALPFEKTQSEPEWFSDYLKRRHAAFHKHGTALESFCPTNVEAAEFIDEPGKVDKPFAVRSIDKQEILNARLADFRNRERIRLRHFAPAKGKGPTYVLLNDTADLETYRHLGCNHVLGSLHESLEEIGFQYLYSVNEPSDVRAKINPDWVIINGEGSFHHDSFRGKALLDIASFFRAQGCKTALLNTIWESNGEEITAKLSGLDMIAVRDGNSLKALNEKGITARLTPDFSLSQWKESPDLKPHNRIVFCDSIVYERARKLFDACLYLNGDYLFLDHRKMGQLNLDGCFAASPKDRLTPALLTSTNQLAAASVVVTGRFHAAVGCVALKKPFLFVESNTNKISSLCQDVGISPELLNVTREIESLDFEGLRNRITRVRSEFSTLSTLLEQYKSNGFSQTKSLFKELQGLGRHASRAG